jgi:hypothetical protein
LVPSSLFIDGSEWMESINFFGWEKEIRTVFFVEELFHFALFLSETKQECERINHSPHGWEKILQNQDRKMNFRRLKHCFLHFNRVIPRF